MPCSPRIWPLLVPPTVSSEASAKLQRQRRRPAARCASTMLLRSAFRKMSSVKILLKLRQPDEVLGGGEARSSPSASSSTACTNGETTKTR